MYHLSRLSLKRLSTVHEDLQVVVKLAITLTECDFVVLEGIRSEARQAELVAIGASKTMRSRHLTGHAVDLGAWVNHSLSWHWPHYYQIADAMRRASKASKIPIEWGGDWKSFPDGPHFQLPRKQYPAR